jgi:hypothetical protein
MDDHGNSRHDHDEQELPTTDHPLHGPRKPALGPAVMTVLVIGTVVLLLYLGFLFIGRLG